jgi:hypothetical protein
MTITLGNDFSDKVKSMRFPNSKFWYGLVLGTITPALAIFSLFLIGSLILKGPGAWAAGPQCYSGARKMAASPNGRYVATSIMIACEDDEQTHLWNYNYVFVTATRLSRTSQIYYLARKSPNPADILWQNNHLITLKIDEDDQERASGIWCGIAVTSRTSVSP